MSLLLLIVVLGAVGITLAGSAAVAAHSNGDMPRSVGSQVGSFVVTAAWSIALLCAVAVLVFFSWTRAPLVFERPQVVTAEPQPPVEIPPDQERPGLASSSSSTIEAAPVANPAEIPIVPAQPAPAAEVELPDWVKQTPAETNDVRWIVVSGRQFSTAEEARADALREAARVFEHTVREDERYRGEWSMPSDFVERHAIRQSFVEPVTRSTPKNVFKVYRVYLQLEYSPATLSQFESVWAEQQMVVRQRTVEKRIWGLGAMAGLAALSFTTLAGYLRLDDRTQGSYRGRLRLAAVSLIAAGGAAAALVVNYV